MQCGQVTAPRESDPRVGRGGGCAEFGACRAAAACLRSSPFRVRLAWYARWLVIGVLLCWFVRTVGRKRPALRSNSMSIQWAGLGPELLLRLDRGLAEPLRSQLERELRDAIRAGRLLAGERLPSSRELARELGVSRGLVQECYAQLLAEGYLSARSGSGTRVAAGAAHQAPAAVHARRRGRARRSTFASGSRISGASRAGTGCGRCARSAGRHPRTRSDTAIHAAASGCGKCSRRICAGSAARSPIRSIVVCAGYAQGSTSCCARSRARRAPDRVRGPRSCG